MTRTYLINHTIRFNPDNHTLVAKDGVHKPQPLNVPTSRCLALLIERRPNLVPQSDFYAYIWGEAGNTVSINTLYQNIALLRKALRNADDGGENFVITVPKRGFKFSPSVSVEEDILLTDEATDSSAQQTNSDKPHPAFFARSKEKVRIRYVIPMLLGAIAMGVFVGYSIPESTFFDGYKIVEKSSDCTYFSHNENSKNIIADLHSLGISLNCQITPFVYITANSYKNLSSLMACNRQFSRNVDLQCVSFTLSTGKPHGSQE